jgi:hypothetical protein
LASARRTDTARPPGSGRRGAPSWGSEGAEDGRDAGGDCPCRAAWCSEGVVASRGRRKRYRLNDMWAPPSGDSKDG